MKVALVTSWGEPCGVADYAAGLAGGLAGRVQLEVVPLRREKTAAKAFRALARACRGADLVHVQHEYVYFNGIRRGRYRWPDFVSALDRPYLVTVHTRLDQPAGPAWKLPWRMLRKAWQEASGWRGYLEAGQYAGARRVIVHTRGHRRRLLERGLPPGRVVVLPQGVPAASPPGRADRARERWDLEGPVVVLFGFLNPAKGHGLALEAWRRFRPPATLVIAGRAFSAREEGYARRLAAAAAAVPGVRLLGYLEDQALADLLAACDCVLLPYRSATSSYALSLALGRGRAVLASDLEHFREVHDARPCLALFRAGRADDLAARLGELLNAPGERVRLQSEARSWAEAHAWTRVAADTAELYAEVLAGK